ncbi:MAG TPA: hypothetical protein VK698_22155 [Kofleriaceae bacterium]|nr:hypothetical protein [Kofleriaceae bacterium]
MEPGNRTEIAGARHKGPPLVLLAGLFAALSLAAVVVVIAMSGGDHFPSPFEPAGRSAAFFAAHAGAVQLGALFAFAAAIPLGLYTATVVSRLHFLGLRVAGVHIALFGGLAASLFMAGSGLAMWTLSQPGVADVPTSARAVQLLTFAAGGPGHVVPLGLLVAGVAVSAGLARLLPRWMMVFGLVVAVVAELSTLTLILPAAAYALPLARLSAFVWLIAAALMLPVARRAAA